MAHRRRFAGCAVLAAIAFQVVLSSLRGDQSEIVSNVLLAGVIGWTTLTMTRAALREHGRARRIWAMGSAGMSCWWLSQLMDAVNSLAPIGRTPVLVATILDLLALVGALSTVLMIPPVPRHRAGRLRIFLDGTLIGGSLFWLGWLLVLGPLWRGTDGGQQTVTSAAYVIGSIVVLSACLLLVAGDREVTAVTLLSSGIAVVTLYTVSVAVLVIRGSAHPNTGAAGAIVLAALLFGAAPSLPLPKPVDRPGTWEPMTVFGRVLPYTPVAAVAVASIVSTVRTGTLEPGLAWGAFLIVGAVLARQFLSVWINGRLAAELTEQRARLAHQATHDPLTGLANRTILHERMTAALRRPAAVPALLLVDLDGFKTVNDTLGHAAGDLVLVTVAERLRASTTAGWADAAASTGTPADVTVARLGGDEFAILLDGVVTASTATALAGVVLAALAQPADVHLPGRARSTVDVDASVGVVLAGPAHRVQPGQLLRDADLAMYAAKAAGKGRYRLADDELTERALTRLRLEGELRSALAGGELEVHYQPIVELATETVTGAEALVRWRHPQRGLLPPAMFLPVAEASGLLPQMDRWVLGEACRQAAEWRRRVGSFSVSVNICAGYLTAGTLVADVDEALRAAGLPAEALVLELTETAVVTDMVAAAAVLTELAATGVRVALDDFGTGYASLAYLRALPIHTIKIDRSFVTGLGEDATNDAVTRAIVGLAGTLGMQHVAEGVETDGQVDQLRDLRCRYGQGYLFSRPVPAADLDAMLGEGGRTRQATSPQEPLVVAASR